MTDETKDLGSVLALAVKLDDLAARAGTPEEAANAVAKRQALLLKHNLTIEAVAQARGKDGKREEQNVDGGFYSFHRELWKAVAELNFCVYWTQKYTAKDQPYSVVRRGEYLGKGRKDMVRRRHAVVGRQANVRETVEMARYLIGAVERVLVERLSGHEGNMKSPWAWSFRRGALESITLRLKRERRKVLDKEEADRRRAEHKAKRSGVSLATALTVSAYTKSEEEANYDFLNGPGAWAALEKAVAEANQETAERRRLMTEAYTKWCAANPKKAQSQFEYTHTDGSTWYYSSRSSGRSRGPHARRSEARDTGAYYAGYEAADKIGLSKQLDSGRGHKIGGRR